MQGCGGRKRGIVGLGALFVALLGGAKPVSAEEEVRIALSSDEKSVRVGGVALTIYDADVGDALVQFSGDAEAVLQVESGNVRVRARLGREKRMRSVGRVRRVLVEAQDAVRVDRGVYFGRIEVAVQKGGRRLMVLNRLRLEVYLLGIVGSEMNPEWPLQALKAQAVAARTYAMQRRAMMRAANRPYDLASTVISQVYKGAERIRPSVIEAVRATRGEVLSHRHDLVEALFHSTCGGRTVSAKNAFTSKVDYLVSRPCEWCRASHRYRWKLSFRLSEVGQKLSRFKLISGKILEFRRRPTDAKVKVRDPKGWRALRPRDVRRAIGFGVLYSERFTAKTVNGRVEIRGRGFGHGVGMCQWGARGLALEGKSHVEILEHYYPGTRLLRLY